MDFVSFMNGNNEPYVNELTERMSQASLDQDYERAAILRDNISALKTVASKSAIVLSDSVDTDIFGIAADGLSAAVQQFIVREGRIRGVHSWSVDTELDVSEEELIDNMLRTAYQQDMVPPKQIYIPSLPEDAKSIQEWLTSIKHERSNVHSGLTVKLKVAQRGEIAALAATVSANAQQALLLYKTRRSADYVTRTQALSDIQEVLGLSESPLRIECFDISHLSGTNTVASMVVFEDGLAKKSDYRKFIIKNPRDDTAAMSEVISRRGAYLTGKEKDQDKREGSFAYPPGLFVVDGGVPQVNAAAQALHSAGIDIPVVGIAKRLEELWLPNNPYPVILPRNSEALFLLQKLRDEAHRFALTFQRQKRSSSISSALSDINGLGPKKVALLLKHFTSLTQIKNASIEEISTVPGISEHLAREIKRQLTIS
jgi:excinuclease ABC subunit C